MQVTNGFRLIIDEIETLSKAENIDKSKVEETAQRALDYLKQEHQQTHGTVAKTTRSLDQSDRLVQFRNLDRFSRHVYSLYFKMGFCESLEGLKKTAIQELSVYFDSVASDVQHLLLSFRQANIPQLEMDQYLSIMTDMLSMKAWDVKDDQLQSLYADYIKRRTSVPVREWLEVDAAVFSRTTHLSLLQQCEAYIWMNNDFGREGFTLRDKKYILQKVEECEREQMTKSLLSKPLDKKFRDLPWPESMFVRDWLPQLILLWQNGEQALVEEMSRLFCEKEYGEHSILYYFFNRKGYRYENIMNNLSSFKRDFNRFKGVPKQIWKYTSSNVKVKDVLALHEKDPRLIQDILTLDENVNRYRLMLVAARNVALARCIVDLELGWSSSFKPFRHFLDDAVDKQLSTAFPLFQWMLGRLRAQEDPSKVVRELVSCLAFCEAHPDLSRPLLKLPSKKMDLWSQLIQSVDDVTKITKSQVKSLVGLPLYYLLYAPWKNHRRFIDNVRQFLEQHRDLINPFTQWLKDLSQVHRGKGFRSENILEILDEGLKDRKKETKWLKPYLPLIVRLMQLEPSRIEMAFQFGKLFFVHHFFSRFLKILDQDADLALQILEIAKTDLSVIPRLFQFDEHYSWWKGKEAHKGLHTLIQAWKADFALTRLILKTFKKPGEWAQLIALMSHQPQKIRALCEVRQRFPDFPLEVLHNSQFVHLIQTNPIFRKELERLLRSICSLIPDFSVFRKLGHMVDINPQKAIEYLQQSGGHERELKRLINGYLGTFDREEDPQQQRVKDLLNHLSGSQSIHRPFIQDAILSLLEKAQTVGMIISPKPKVSKEMLTQLAIDLLELFVEDDHLARDFVDMAKGGFIDEVNHLLQYRRKGDSSRFIHNVLANANSNHGHAINKALSLDPKKHPLVYNYLSSLSPAVFFTPFNNALMTLSLNGHDEIAGDLINAKAKSPGLQSTRERMLIDWLQHGFIARVGWVHGQPIAIWETDSSLKLPSELQAMLWDLFRIIKRKPAGPKLQALYGRIEQLMQESLRSQVGQKSLRNTVGAIHYLLRFDPAALYDYLFYRGTIRLENRQEDLSSLCLSCKRSPRRIQEAWFQGVKNDDESGLQMAFSLTLAQCLLTESGGINEAMIDPLLHELLLQKNSYYPFPHQSDFAQFILRRCDALKTFAPEVGQRLMSIQTVPAKGSVMDLMLRKMLRKKEGELSLQDVRMAILSALLTNVRQHPNVGSCFATSFAIATHSGRHQFLPILDEYIHLISGSLVIREGFGPDEKVRDYPVVVDYPSLNHDGPVQDNLLSRAREYTIAHMAGKISYTLEVLFGDPHHFGIERDLIYKILASLTDKQQAIKLGEELKKRLEKWLIPVYDPYKTVDSKRGFWGHLSKFTHQMIQTPEDFLQFLNQLIQTTEQELMASSAEKSQEISDILSRLRSHLNETFLRDLFNTLRTEHLKNPLKQYQQLHTLPWGHFEGGKSEEIKETYHGRKEHFKQTAIWSDIPHVVLSEILHYLNLLPSRSKALILQDPHLVLPIQWGSHAANLRPYELAVKLYRRDQDPDEILNELFEESARFRQQVMPEALKQTFLLYMTRITPGLSEGLLPYLRQQTSAVNTIGAFADKIWDILECLGTFDFNELSQHYELGMRQLVASSGLKVPQVLRLLDTNWAASGHNHVYLGFGGSLMRENSLCQFRMDGWEGHPLARNVAKSPWTLSDPFL